MNKKTGPLPKGPLLGAQPKGPLLGAHMSISGGLENALLGASKLGCGCVQMFVVNQRQWKRPPLDPGKLETFLRVRGETGLKPVVAHGIYLINPAAENPETYRKSMESLRDEWSRCNSLGIDYYVLHPGSHVGAGEKAGLKKVIKSLDILFSETVENGRKRGAVPGGRDSPVKCRLLLETMAGQGTALGYKFEHLAEIIGCVERPEYLGVCLDTCHIFAAGYDFRSMVDFNKMIGEFDRIIGLEKLHVIHTNDSKKELGSRRDRHENIGEGKIGIKGFKNFLTDERTKNLPFILETPKGKSPGGCDLDVLNLNRLRKL